LNLQCNFQSKFRVKTIENTIFWTSLILRRLWYEISENVRLIHVLQGRIRWNDKTSWTKTMDENPPKDENDATTTFETLLNNIHQTIDFLSRTTIDSSRSQHQHQHQHVGNIVGVVGPRMIGDGIIGPNRTNGPTEEEMKLKSEALKQGLNSNPKRSLKHNK
jgi:hypothetical protein